MVFDRATNSLNYLTAGKIAKSYNTGVLDSYKKLLSEDGVDGAMRTVQNVSSAFNPTKDLIKAVYRQTGNNQSRSHHLMAFYLLYVFLASSFKSSSSTFAILATFLKLGSTPNS